jgi:hypothetical protein
MFENGEGVAWEAGASGRYIALVKPMIDLSRSLSSLDNRMCKPVPDVRQWTKKNDEDQL